MFSRIAAFLSDRTGRRRRLTPVVDRLEDRKLLYATNGGLWTYPVRITYSFAPDGTSIGGTPSSLYQTMASQGISQATWQLQFEKAAAVWEAVANINLVQVPDNGEAFGATGDQQGDPNVGDIRIGAIPMQTSTLAETFLPPPYNGGTLAGDMVLNTNDAWNVGSNYDLETVAIHEIGHALGMGHSGISSAVMYANYTGVKQSLSNDDSKGVESIYGGLQDTVNNGSYTSASSITGDLDSQGQITLSGLQITSASDYDWYYVVAPASTTGTMTVTMQSSGLSSLSPKFSVYNASLVGLATATAPNSYGATVTATISGVAPGQGFYIKCMAANPGPSSTGTFGLQVNFGSGPMNPIPPPSTVVPWQPDQGGGSASQTIGGDPGQGHGVAGDPPGLVQLGNLNAYGEPLLAGPRVHATSHKPSHHRPTPRGPRHTPFAGHRGNSATEHHFGPSGHSAN